MQLLRLSLICLLVFVCPACLAEEAAPETAGPRGLLVTDVHIKQGGVQAFEQVAAKFKEASARLGMPSYFATSPAVGDDRLYQFATPFMSFTELAENRNVLAEAFDEEEAARLFALLADSVERVDTFLAFPRTDLSIPAPPPDAAPEIAIAVTIQVKRGRNADYVAYAEKLIEATKQVAPGVYFNSYATDIGGAVNSFTLRTNRTWADLDNPPMPIPERLVKAFGKKRGEKIYEDGVDAIESMEISIRRLRPDLTHINSDR